MGAAGMSAAGTGAAGTGAAGTGATGTGASGTGASGTGVSGTGASGTGASGTGGTGAGAGGSGGGSGGAPAEMHMDLGKGDGSDVITIGDSWMNLIFTGIEPSLDSVSGQHYRHYAVPGTLVLNEQIPGQYESAKQANPAIKTVVMTGGGNDILTSS